MRRQDKLAPKFLVRTSWALVAVFAVLALAVWSAPPTSANHPVLVEGNCDSPVPGTTIVQQGTCGDFDGDGRIGTAEDTDGADRIFGTISAAVGPGTGAAAGTGANFNGRVIIVKSGRYSEAIDPMTTNSMITLNIASHLQIEAAPGVEANLDAVFQGDPAGGNTARQGGIGISMNLGPGASVILKNLTIRNFLIGIRQRGSGRLLLDNCRVDNNLDYGVEVLDQSNLLMEQGRITGTGRRIGGPANTTPFGHGLHVADSASAVLNRSLIFNSKGAGVQNTSVVATFDSLISYNDAGPVIGNAIVKGTY